MICAPDGELWSPPILVDFNKYDWDGRLRLDYLRETQEYLNSYKIELVEGKRLVLFDLDWDAEGTQDDLIGVGDATFDSEEGRWVVALQMRPNYTSVRPGLHRIIYFSELDPKCQLAYRKYRPEGAGLNASDLPPR